MNRRLGILAPFFAGALAWAQGRPAHAQALTEKTAASASNEIWKTLQDVCKKMPAACVIENVQNVKAGPGVRSVPKDELLKAIAALELLAKFYPLTINVKIDEARFKAQQSKLVNKK